ncbi:putative zinc finger protein [Orchesella cincta]|uniref:Putative zinc finger protein n=1 Tax=Orchesella cincta TaxID=48709 RepID=A0A1D2MY61_ORCCI|nr:putative zinc finger protein [Orchesella cincta]
MEESSTSTSTSREKVLRRSLSLKEKMDIIFQLEKEGPSICALSKKLQIPRATISRIWKDREKIRINFQNKDSNLRRCRPSEFGQIDEALLQWYNSQKSLNNDISIGGPALSEKASEFAEVLNVPNFRNSNGWLEKWKKRHNIKFKTVIGLGVSAEIDTETKEVILTETEMPSFKEMCLAKPRWNRCFICSTTLSKTTLSKNDDKHSSLPAIKILLQYLLQTNQHNEKRLYEDVLLCILEGGGNGSKLFMGSGVKLCSFCKRLSNDIKELHLQLDILQMKIIDKLEVVKETVITNSSLYGSNASVKVAVGNFEHWTKRQEAIGRNCGTEKQYFDIMYRFQNFVFENDIQLKKLPLVYLQKYTGASGAADMLMKRQNVKHEGIQEISLKVEDEHETVDDWLPCSIEHDYDPSCADSFSHPPSPKRKSMIKDHSQPIVKKKMAHRKTTEQDSTDSTDEETLTEAQRLAIEIRKAYLLKPYSGPSRKGKKKTFFCSECPFQVKKAPSRFEQHLREHEIAEANYTCPDCLRTFSQKQFYEFHISHYCGSKSWKCAVCNEPVHGGRLKEHLEANHEGKVYSCAHCDNCFGSFTALITHSQYHPGWSLKCDYCPEDDSKNYSRRCDIRRHLYEVHNHTELLLKCNFENCESGFFDVPTLTNHMNVHLKRFVCNVCNKPFSLRDQLEAHVRTQHHEEKPFECDQCSEKFSLRDSLQRHKMRAHNYSKFKCQLCPKEFADRIGMEWHMQASHGIGNRQTFHCGICEKNFFRKSILKKHLATHSDRNEFTCHVCGFGTRSNSLLKVHMVKHDGAKNHVCNYCSKTFTLLKYLKDHLRTHTLERPYICEVCGAAFNQKGSLNIHKKKHDDGG